MRSRFVRRHSPESIASDSSTKDPSVAERTSNSVLLRYPANENELRYRPKPSYESSDSKEVELMELDKVTRLFRSFLGV